MMELACNQQNGNRSCAEQALAKAVLASVLGPRLKYNREKITVRGLLNKAEAFFGGIPALRKENLDRGLPLPDLVALAAGETTQADYSAVDALYAIVIFGPPEEIDQAIIDVVTRSNNPEMVSLAVKCFRRFPEVQQLAGKSDYIMPTMPTIVPKEQKPKKSFLDSLIGKRGDGEAPLITVVCAHNCACGARGDICKERILADLLLNESPIVGRMGLSGRITVSELLNRVEALAERPLLDISKVPRGKLTQTVYDVAIGTTTSKLSAADAVYSIALSTDDDRDCLEGVLRDVAKNNEDPAVVALATWCFRRMPYVKQWAPQQEEQIAA